MERVFRRGLAVFRWGAWIWMAAVLVIYWNTDYLRHRYVALALVLLALGFTVAQTALVPGSVRFVNRRRVAAGELAAALTIMALDGYVRREDIIFVNGATLGSWWPVVGLLSAATYLPMWGAVIAGLSFGVARTISVVLNGIPIDSLSGGEILSLIGTGVFGALAAASVCGLMKMLRDSESKVALARAREEVARTLHDGVLQTLAIVERRSDDKDLVQLAHDQQRELRAYLFGQDKKGTELELGSELLLAAKRFESAFSGQVNVVVAPDIPDVPPASIQVLVGAVAEALTNAGKHGESSKITVYVEPADDDGIFCSVKDDGVGFDPEATQAGVGQTRSIRGRIEEVGGRVEIKSSLGNGTEVLLWLPPLT